MRVFLSLDILIVLIYTVIKQMDMEVSMNNISYLVVSGDKNEVSSFMSSGLIRDEYRGFFGSAFAGYVLNKNGMHLHCVSACDVYTARRVTLHLIINWTTLRFALVHDIKTDEGATVARIWMAGERGMVVDEGGEVCAASLEEDDHEGQVVMVAVDPDCCVM